LGLSLSLGLSLADQSLKKYFSVSKKKLGKKIQLDKKSFQADKRRSGCRWRLAFRFRPDSPKRRLPAIMEFAVQHFP